MTGKALDRTNDILTLAELAGANTDQERARIIGTAAAEKAGSKLGGLVGAGFGGGLGLFPGSYIGEKFFGFAAGAFFDNLGPPPTGPMQGSCHATSCGNAPQMLPAH